MFSVDLGPWTGLVSCLRVSFSAFRRAFSAWRASSWELMWHWCLALRRSNRCRTPFVCERRNRNEGVRQPLAHDCLHKCAFAGRRQAARRPHSEKFLRPPSRAGRSGARLGAPTSARARERRKLVAPEPPLAALWRCGPRSLSCKHAVAAAPGAEAAPDASVDQGSPPQHANSAAAEARYQYPSAKRLAPKRPTERQDARPHKAWDNSFAYGAGRDPKPYKSVHVGTGGENAKSDAWLQKSMSNLEKTGGSAYRNNMSEKDREKLLSRMAAAGREYNRGHITEAAYGRYVTQLLKGNKRQQLKDIHNSRRPSSSPSLGRRAPVAEGRMERPQLAESLPRRTIRGLDTSYEQKVRARSARQRTRALAWMEKVAKDDQDVDDELDDALPPRRRRGSIRARGYCVEGAA